MELYLFRFKERVFVFSGTRPLAQISIYRPRSLISIYQSWLIRIGNDKSQILDTMLLFLFLLSNPFVVVIVDRINMK